MNAKAQAQTVEKEKPAEQPAGQPATANTPAAQAAGGALMVMDYGADAGKGLEDISFDEISIPFIGVVQTNSPQVDPTSAKYNPDAKPGMLFNSSTGETFPGLPIDGKLTGMDFIPCHRDKNYVEYTPRDAGGGFVGVHPVNDPRILQLVAKQGRFKKLKTSSNTELTETKYIYGLFIPAPGYVIPAVMGFSSTKIKHYTRFMDVITKIEYPNPSGQLVNPPMWAHRWHVSVVPDSNKKGKFFNYQLGLVNGAKLPKPIEARLDRSNPDDEAMYQRASALYDSIKAGRATAAHDTTTEGEMDDDIPF